MQELEQLNKPMPNRAERESRKMTAKQNSKKQNKNQKRLTRATKTPATKPAEVAKPAEAGKLPTLTPAPKPLTVAELLNAGKPIEFPKGSNAICATFLGKGKAVILKADVDTLKGVGIATDVEFGAVKNDAKGQPMRDKFEALTSAVEAKPAKPAKPAKTPAVNDGNPFPRTKLRGVFFAQAQTPFKTEQELCDRVLAVMTAKDRTGEKANAEQVKRGYAVVIDPNHRFNGKRSQLEKLVDGGMKLVPAK